MSEFSRIIETPDVPDSGLRRQIAATPDERRAVAERMGLVELASFSGELDVMRRSRGGIRVTGTLIAEFTQVCVVSLDEFSSRAELPVERTYVRHQGGTKPVDAIVIDPVVDDEPDLLIDDKIDLGELLVETMALALDPYPRKPGAEFEAPSDDVSGQDKVHADNPFAVLAKLNRRH